MSIQLSTHRFTVHDFHRMAQAGIFSEDDRVELLDGEIIEMTPIGSRHAACVARLTKILSHRLGETAIVWAQNPIRLDDRTEPQPDVAVLRERRDFYKDAHPGPADVLLVIEVSDASAEVDRRVKLPLYAKTGIGEVWIVDLSEGVVLVYRQPSPQGYRTSSQARGVDQLTPEALPNLALSASDIVI
ncbi:MAG: Uma2 family endonuclease [Nitrospirae bacterium]|nr:MAG: Uma2 family endonuclease [Nitrospirota bacterium]